MKIRTFIPVILLAIILMALGLAAWQCPAPAGTTGVDAVVKSSQKAVGGEPKIINYNQAKLLKEWAEYTDDSFTIQWIACLSDIGQVIYYGPVLGNVISVDRTLEPTTVTGSIPFKGYHTSEYMARDGMYGKGDSYAVHWKTPSGEWKTWTGNYFLSSTPFMLPNPVLGTTNIDGNMLTKQQLAIAVLRRGGCVNDLLVEIDCATGKPMER